MIDNLSKHLSESLKNKRIAAIDYGTRRIGVAVCDPLHITVTPKQTIDSQHENKVETLVQFINKEKIEALVIGIPFREDSKNDKFIVEIRDFANKIQELTNLNVYEYDEAFSSVSAMQTMLEVGHKKKKRSVKANKDMIAAAIILRSFLESIE